MRAILRTIFQLFTCSLLCGLLFSLSFHFNFLHHRGYVSLNISALATFVFYFLIIVIQNVVAARITKHINYVNFSFVILAVLVAFFFFPIFYITSDSPRSAAIFSIGFIISYILTTLLFYKRTTAPVADRN